MSHFDEPKDKKFGSAGESPDRKEPDFSYKSRLMSGDSPLKTSDLPLDNSQKPTNLEEMNVIRELIKPHLAELQNQASLSMHEGEVEKKSLDITDPPELDPVTKIIHPKTTYNESIEKTLTKVAPPPLPTNVLHTPAATPKKRVFDKNEGLAIHQLGKAFKKRPVLRNVSLNVHRGEAVGLLGPNGAGKTTCFYMISGLIAADYGDITLDGQDITELPMYRRARLGIGYLPQEASIFRGLTVEENILAILEVVEKKRHLREATLEALLAEFSITHLRRTPSIALSGGERRRLEIARALASQPHFILLDEPLAGIDPIAVRDIRDLVGHLKDRGIGVLITDHNVRETLGIVDRAYILHEGRVLMEGTPEEIVQNDEVKRVYLGEAFQLEGGTE